MHKNLGQHDKHRRRNSALYSTLNSTKIHSYSCVKLTRKSVACLRWRTASRMSGTSSLTTASWIRRRMHEILGSSSTGNKYAHTGLYYSFVLIIFYHIEVLIHCWRWIGLFIASIIDWSWTGLFETKGNERKTSIYTCRSIFTVIVLTGIWMCGHSVLAWGQTDARSALRLGSLDAQGNSGCLFLRRRSHPALGPLVPSRRREDLPGVAQVRKKFNYEFYVDFICHRECSWKEKHIGDLLCHNRALSLLQVAPENCPQRVSAEHRGFPCG